MSTHFRLNAMSLEKIPPEYCIWSSLFHKRIVVVGHVRVLFKKHNEMFKKEEGLYY